MKMTKKKGKSSILLQICVLITLITVLSALTILWLAARSEAGISEQHVIAPSVVGTVVGGVSEKVATREELVATLSPTQSGTTVPVTINRKAVVLSKHIHFIHIPKCGGTTMTTLLRQMQCITDPVKNADCCLNPGFCDWHAHRRCATIQGCINHFPNR